MRRRDALKSIISAITVGAFATPSFARDGDDIVYFGATKPSQMMQTRVKRRPRRSFYERFGALKGASESRNVFLWKYLEQETGGPLVPHYQGPVDGAQGEGDCVGQAGSLGCDILAATEKNMLGEREKFVAKASVEMSYAGGRVEIGNLGRNDLNPIGLKGRGGSHGEWQVRYYKEYGVLHRLEYRDGDNYIDLRGYHPTRSRKYRDVGVPDWLEKEARDHPVEEYTNVQSAQEALDAVSAGQPVIICSSYAIRNTRDNEGFSKPYLGPRGMRWGRFLTKQWWHCMLLAGSITGARPGGVILNSHGEWNSGPQPYGIPDGGFAVDLEHLDTMIKDWGDCYAISSYKGHESEKIKRKIKLF